MARGSRRQTESSRVYSDSRGARETARAVESLRRGGECFNHVRGIKDFKVVKVFKVWLGGSRAGGLGSLRSRTGNAGALKSRRRVSPPLRSSREVLRAALKSGRYRGNRRHKNILNSRGAYPPIFAARAAVWAGEVPQHPPTMLHSPRRRYSSIASANASGCSSELG